jgi:hypothetical protein
MTNALANAPQARRLLASRLTQEKATKERQATSTGRKRNNCSSAGYR